MRNPDADCRPGGLAVCSHVRLSAGGRWSFSGDFAGADAGCRTPTALRWRRLARDQLGAFAVDPGAVALADLRPHPTLVPVVVRQEDLLHRLALRAGEVSAHAREH